MNLRGRRALVTGAAGHLGRVLAGTLAELEASLLLVDRPEADYGPLTKALAPWRAELQILPCDLERDEERQALIETVCSQGAVSILVNNAAFVGTSRLPGWASRFGAQALPAWRRALDVNLVAAFDLCQGLAPAMQEAPGANIVNIASLYGMLGPDWRLYRGTDMANPAAYAASKGGLIQLTRWLATTLAPAIRVNTISPGGVWRSQPASFVQAYEERTPLGRMAVEQDLAGALAFLATDMAAYVTGHNLAVDGGWSAW